MPVRLPVQRKQGELPVDGHGRVLSCLAPMVRAEGASFQGG